MKSAKLYSINIVTVGEYLEPRLVSERQVKIRVKYCGIGKDDYAMYSGTINARYANYGLLTEFSGEIIELGRIAKESGFSIGDKVSATRFVPCGNCPMCRSGKPNLCVELSASGCLEEVIIADCRKIVKLPKEMPIEYGVFFDSAARCLHAIEKMNLRTGESVCILGDDSTALIMAQLIRKKMPGLLVICSDFADKNKIAVDLGVDRIVNSSGDNLAETTLDLTDGFGFDHIIDCNGNASFVESSINLLARGGQLTIIPNYSFGTKIKIDLAEMHWKEIKIQSIYEPEYATYTYNAMFLRELNLEALVGAIFPLEEINEAFEQFATGRYQKILIRL